MKCLSYIDFFSRTPCLKINNSDKYHTIFGLIISILTIFSISSIVIYFIFTCFSRISYQILERMDHTLIPSTKIFKNKISFTITDPLGYQFKEPDRLFSIEAKFGEVNPTARSINKNIVNFTDIPLTNCSIYQNEPFKERFDNLTNVFNTSKCLDFSNLKTNLYGQYGSMSG